MRRCAISAALAAVIVVATASTAAAAINTRFITNLRHRPPAQTMRENLFGIGKASSARRTHRRAPYFGLVAFAPTRCHASAALPELQPKKKNPGAMSRGFPPRARGACSEVVVDAEAQQVVGQAVVRAGDRVSAITEIHVEVLGLGRPFLIEADLHADA